MIFSLLLSVSASPALAAAQSYSAPSTAQIPIDAAELRAALDPVIAAAMEAAHIPGAVLLVVRDGEVMFSKGYGMADIATNRTINPDTDVWRVMSLSKPVTAMTVLKLAEQGRIDLAADVNSYLASIRLRGGYAAPVTAHALLTHTAGLDFDLDDIGGEAKDPAKLLSLSRFLAQYPPARVRPPGQMVVYSNKAFDTLGLLVEDVAREPFEDYVRTSIFAPLGMTSSSFAQPPPAVDRLVTAYEWDGQTHRPVPLPLYQNPPSRALTASAPDIARFMLALLGRGASDSVRVLNESSAEKMLTTQYAAARDVAGAAYGFDERRWNRGRMLWKDGHGAGALSRIVLYPDDNWGFFLSYNLDDGFALAQAANNAIAERYYPEMKLATAPTAGQMGSQPDVTGIYRVPGYSRATIAKALRLMWAPYPRVDAGPDGALLVTYNPGSEPITLTPVGPLRYRDLKESLDYVFVTDERGAVTHYAVGSYAAEKTPLFDQDRTHRAMLAGFALVFLLGALAWPIAAFMRRRRGKNLISRLERAALALLAVTSGLNLFLLVTLFAMLGFVDFDYSAGMPLPLTFLLTLPFITGLLALILLLVAVRAWRAGSFSAAGRTALTLAAVVALLFIPWLSYWNLLGWRW